MPLRRDRRERLDTLQTGDGRRMPGHLKAQVRRGLDRPQPFLEQIKAAEAQRDVLLAANELQRGRRGCSTSRASGRVRRTSGRRALPTLPQSCQVASYAGLSPTPWRDGSIDPEQAVLK